MRIRDMKERHVEEELVYDVVRSGGRAYKFVSPSRRGVPDRLVLMSIPEEHRELVSRYVRFVELKAPGEKPSKQQLLEHRRLANLGFVVHVVDNPLDGQAVVQEMKSC